MNSPYRDFKKTNGKIKSNFKAARLPGKCLRIQMADFHF